MGATVGKWERSLDEGVVLGGDIDFNPVDPFVCMVSYPAVISAHVGLCFTERTDGAGGACYLDCHSELR